MKFFLPFIIVIGLILDTSYSFRSSNQIFDTISRRIHLEQLDQVADVGGLDSVVTLNLSELDVESGRWKGVDYFDHKRINPNWLPILEKMRKLTVAYSHPQSKYYGDTTLWKAINRSLSYFSNHDPIPYCDNWFQQGITRPQKLALSLINMKFGLYPLDEPVRNSTLAVICRDTAVTSNGRNNPMHKYNFGANKAEIALGWIYIGALTNNKDMLEVGVREVFAPISYTTGEGIQHDLSYDMHYGYLYNGAYGLVFANSVVKSAHYLWETPYALQGEKLDLFRKFILESVFGVMRGPWMDWNVLGRGISRINATKMNLDKLLAGLQQIDPYAGQQYEAIRLRMRGEKPLSYAVQPLHRVYWSTDFTVHSRPFYYLSIHAVSNRNHAQEIGNMENLQGYWGAQGTVNLMLKGDEYNNIFPVWDWAKFPGSTLPDTIPILQNKAPGEGDRWGTDAFSGGVSDSLYGVSAYVVRQDLNTYSKKSWFMFDEEVVCLGAGIRSTLPYKVSTTVNQCIYDDEGIYLGQNRKQMYLQKNTQNMYDNDLNWLIHGGIAYLFPNKGTVELKVDDRRSDWSTIRGGDRHYRKLEEKSVFQLTLEHGEKPIDASYAYIIVPNIHTPEMLQKYRSKDNIIIMSNSDQLQAVFHKKLKIWQIVFYEKEIPYTDGQLKVWTDIPAALMIKELNRGIYQLHVADPSQQHSRIHVNIATGGKAAAQTYTVDLPQKPYAGQTVAIQIGE